MKKLLFIYLLLFSIPFFAQLEDAWVFLKNKPQAETFIANPLTMLSQRALDRRSRLYISLDVIDVPIDGTYYTELKKEATVTILAKSKWLNAIHVQGEVSDIRNLLSNYSFIDRVEFANRSLNASKKSSRTKIEANHQNKFNQKQTNFNYGDASHQIKMLKGDYLHQQGLTGDNQIIAILDAGFLNVDTFAAFQRIRENNQILGGYNFADRNTNFYTRSGHGTHVLSTIGGYLEDTFVGTAPDAKFYLFITEISETETVLEETLWVEAAEKADSLGVDVINTSLGYTTFDNANHSYTYQDMDGKTTFISRGAEIGASRGLLLVNSAGNSGNNTWKYIGAPADAPSVISVGAVDASGEIASFSSFGPTADGRVKPEILGQGKNPALINYATGLVSTSSSGTSYSGPIIAGLITCLNQNDSFLLRAANQKQTTENLNDLLKKAVYKSADRYSNPTDQYGYGLPDFQKAHRYYFYSLSVEDNPLEKAVVYPNPIQSSFRIDIPNGIVSDFSIEIYNVIGKKVFEKISLQSNDIDVSKLDKGIYVLKIIKGSFRRNIKLIKQ